MSIPVRLLLTIDVEEEGLFGGTYARQGVSVRNVAYLSRLVPLLRETDMPVTLLCTHSVFANADAARVLDALRAQCRVEIGAHLHHWNTPPVNSDGASTAASTAYCSAGAVPDNAMREKLHHLFAAGACYAGHPLTSFRMGRWDMHRRHWPLLADCGVRVDASVRPLHCGFGGPDHFFAPAHPYTVCVAGTEILEVPLTCLPLLACAPLCLAGTAARAARPYLQKYLLLSAQPVYHPLWFMRLATQRMLARGVRVLTLAWHSSEMMPGGAPHVPDASAADALLEKLRAYILWLRRTYTVQGATLDDMRAEPVSQTASVDGDYAW